MFQQHPRLWLRTRCRRYWLKVSLFLWGSVQGLHEQCKNPLYETHWFGKNDIQTLNEFPTVKTNLKLCPAYNEKASCCHQTFESEQKKYFDFWNTMLAAKLGRIQANRKSVNSVVAPGKSGDLSPQDQQQLQVALDGFDSVLSPYTHTDCFSSMVTYIAGMICFSCKPEWFNYALMQGEQFIRLRMKPSVCVELWNTCAPLGSAAKNLKQAIVDSAIAKRAQVAEENLDMFLSQHALCDWMHDTIALHPFSVPPKDSVLEQYAFGRRLVNFQTDFDVMGEGIRSGFDRSWHDPVSGVAGNSPDCLVMAMVIFGVAAWR